MNEDQKIENARGSIDDLNKRPEIPCRALIISEDKVVCTSLKKMLIEFGHTVLGTVSQGTDALSMAREYRPNILFVDIDLGESVKGIETAKRLQSEISSTLVFISNSYDEEVLSKTSGIDAAGYLVIPFNKIDVWNAVHACASEWNKAS